MKYVFTDMSGNPSFTLDEIEDVSYQEGGVYNGMICRPFPQGIHELELFQNYYFKDGWKRREPPEAT